MLHKNHLKYGTSKHNPPPPFWCRLEDETPSPFLEFLVSLSRSFHLTLTEVSLANASLICRTYCHSSGWLMRDYRPNLWLQERWLEARWLGRFKAIYSDFRGLKIVRQFQWLLFCDSSREVQFLVCYSVNSVSNCIKWLLLLLQCVFISC